MMTNEDQMNLERLIDAHVRASIRYKDAPRGTAKSPNGIERERVHERVRECRRRLIAFVRAWAK